MSLIHYPLLALFVSLFSRCHSFARLLILVPLYVHRSNSQAWIIVFFLFISGFGVFLSSSPSSRSLLSSPLSSLLSPPLTLVSSFLPFLCFLFLFLLCPLITVNYVRVIIF